MTKMVSLTDRAYATLSAKKGPGESFSDLVIRLASKDQSGILDLIGSLSGRSKELVRLERQIYRDRRKFKLRSFG